MNKKQRVAYIQKRLGEYYPDPPLPLDHHSPYTLLVAVILSARCTDKRVNQITPQLFAVADTPQVMKDIPVEQVESIIRPCGLGPAKSKAIVALSRILTEKHEGKVPDTFAALEALPGVGHKTASVMMAWQFGKAAFPVDTHVHRLGKRWGLSRGRTVEETERDLKKLFPEEAWYQLHLQFIYYGREHCTARGCDGTRCEICRTCFPKRKKQ